MSDFVIIFATFVILGIPLFILYKVRNTSKAWLWTIFFIIYVALHQFESITSLRKENAFLDTYSTALILVSLALAIRITFVKKRS